MPQTPHELITAASARHEWATNMAARQAIRRHLEVVCLGGRQEHARVFWRYFSFSYEGYLFYKEGNSKMINGYVNFDSLINSPFTLTLNSILKVM